MAAQADPAFHMSFQRHIDGSRRNAAADENRHTQAHHDLGSAHQHDALRRVNRYQLEQFRHHADVIAPTLVRLVAGQQHFCIRKAPP